MKQSVLIRSKVAVAALAFVLDSGLDGSAAVLHVPANYSTIQAAVDAAASGDLIQIAPGVYTNQVVISYKNLTLSGSPGTVLRATASLQQSLISVAGTNAHGVPLLGFFKSDVVVSGLTLEGERLADSQSGDLFGIWFVAASGSVKDCRITGFRGSRLGTETSGWGVGIGTVNPHGYGVGPVNIQVLRSTLADNIISIQLIGDVPPPPPYPPTWFANLVSTTFAVNDNTIVGNGSDATGQQAGIRIWAGAGGEVLRNTISGHAAVGTTDPSARFSFGILADDAIDFDPVNMTPLAALQPVRYEGNIFRNNQIDLMLFRGDGSTIMNNSFEGPALGHRPTGLGFSGDSVLVGTNRFSDLETGILLFGNDDPEFGGYLGAASNATLVANGFCNVATNLTTELQATYTEQGTLTCPSPILDIRAVQLSWPFSYTGYSVEAAPAADGPWSALDATPFQQDEENRVVVPAETDQQFFRLAKP